MPVNNETQESFACDHCDKRFNRKENLTRHLKNHGDKIHICDVCSKAFTRSDLLRRHVALHSTVEGDASVENLSAKRRKHSHPRDDPMGGQDMSPGVQMDRVGMGRSPAQAQGPSRASQGISSDQGTALSNPRLPADDNFWASWPFDLPSYDSRSEFSGSRDDATLFDFPGLGDYDHGGLGFKADLHGPSCSTTVNNESISRATSPPNEASHDDQTPFAWTPSARQVPEPREVTILPQDSLWLETQPEFDLSETTYESIRITTMAEATFLGKTVLRPLQSFPTLPITNIFMSQFVKRFLPQVAALHLSTLDVNSLPTSLLAIMISIGATYCNRRGTRRFSIVLQEWARGYILLAVQADNSLIRSSDTIYAAALICYAGLWNGNKRSFELAEAMRGTVIAWLRRSVAHHSDCTAEEQSLLQDTNTAWRNWIREESQRRLQWIVYSLIDCQYSSLMNTHPMMSLNEVRDWECPCDEDYWTATNAQQWKALLGRATVPPSRAFAIAVAPFLDLQANITPGNLNKWSALLVLLCLTVQTIRRLDERNFLECLSWMGVTSISDPSNQQNERRMRLESRGLQEWKTHYSTVEHRHITGLTLNVFEAIGIDFVALNRVYLLVPIADLQDILGRSHVVGIQQARLRFSTWLENDFSSFSNAAAEAIDILRPYYSANEDVTVRKNPAISATAPYSSIVVFLAHTLLYSCSTVANTDQKRMLFDHITTSAQLSSTDSIYSLLDLAFGQESGKDPSGRPVLRRGAELLFKCETWACSLNLALLLHWRSRM